MGRRKIPMSEREHGLTATYQAGCRCEPCKVAQAAYAKERYEARKRGDVRTRPAADTHGTRPMYASGCRCEECRAAEAAYQRGRRLERNGGVSRRRERQHGVRSTYKAGCRCEPCKVAQAAYAKERYQAAKDAEPVPGVLTEIRIPICCQQCGSPVVQQTPSAATDSGLRVTMMVRCSSPKCRRQWQFTGVLMSMSGAEYQGAA